MAPSRKTAKKATKKAARQAGATTRTSGSVDADVKSALVELKRLSSQRVRDDMADRYAIHTDKAYGVPMSAMQKVAKRLKSRDDGARNHALALALWQTGWYEARTVAAFVDEPHLVTPAQMDRWVKDFDNWGICDTVCFHLFDRTDHAFGKVDRWARGRQEFTKRAGFALLACLALHDKRADDEEFLTRLVLIEQGAADDRNFVKKGVSWALRAIGRRNAGMRTHARETAQRLAESSDAAARWVGKDALKDLGAARRG
jgi:3-methyladenine DNA glycosylase AlkD